MRVNLRAQIGGRPKQVTEVELHDREIEIDPAGDTVLCLGQGDSVIELRVQSQILSAASAALAEKSRSRSWFKLKAGELHHIELTDEGQAADAMKIICEAIHFRSSALHKTFEPRELVATGRVSKKYEFTDALRPWSADWLRRARRVASVPELKELLTAAKLFDAWEEYSRISFDLIRLHIGPFGRGQGIATEITGKTRPGQSKLSNGWAVHLELQRVSKVQEISEIVQTATSALSSLSSGSRSEVSSAWARRIFDRRLWPLGQTSRESSVEGLLEALETFEEPRHVLQSKDLCGCREPGLDLQGKFSAARGVIYARAEGMCLDCINTGSGSGALGECRLRDATAGKECGRFDKGGGR
ncbi:hypothetical protein LTR29_017669 [Friedmanniomyces endolithicus]|nr:hypothetical protein LTR01_008929 [Friedmanniomyces endolithicus]KAK0822880.1 hypothetical protein LTR73_008968 [Friedmanniomyces endolithicus]KAK0927410.1 hypothetical protein LTR29_017669 [Friedmanniomyces endolithicus]